MGGVPILDATVPRKARRSVREGGDSFLQYHGGRGADLQGPSVGRFLPQQLGLSREVVHQGGVRDPSPDDARGHARRCRHYCMGQREGQHGGGDSSQESLQCGGSGLRRRMPAVTSEGRRADARGRLLQEELRLSRPRRGVLRKRHRGKLRLSHGLFGNRCSGQRGHPLGQPQRRHHQRPEGGQRPQHRSVEDRGLDEGVRQTPRPRESDERGDRRRRHLVERLGRDLPGTPAGQPDNSDVQSPTVGGGFPAVGGPPVRGDGDGGPDGDTGLHAVPVRARGAPRLLRPPESHGVRRAAGALRDARGRGAAYRRGGLPVRPGPPHA
mmetsp:Transcript_14149/g.30776  ORF Transcript_14149/g.30776 Transcript_14149/m.30776 type:complete len:325 (-) Transcript_14149:75-1049(-)